MREGRWKLLRGVRGQTRPQLFDLSRDPAERDDRAAAEPARLAGMLMALTQWEQETKRGATQQPDQIPASRR